MIQPIKLSPQNLTSFSGLKKTINDPLNARNAYSKVLEDNRETLKQEALKFNKGTPSENSARIDFKG